MTIRPSCINDLEAIFKIFQDCKSIMEMENIFQWTEYYPSLKIITEDINNGHLYGLYDKEKCIGVISLNNIEAPAYETIEWEDINGAILVIHRLAIRPGYQNQGLARKLMDFAEKQASKKGFTSIRLDAYSGNKRALRFYEQGEYKKRGEVEFNERELPFFCYEKLLSQTNPRKLKF